MTRPLGLRETPEGGAQEPVAFERCCYEVERLASLALLLERVTDDDRRTEAGAVQILASGLLEQSRLLRTFMLMPDDPG